VEMMSVKPVCKFISLGHKAKKKIITPFPAAKAKN
jgi:hypothetical protein